MPAPPPRIWDSMRISLGSAWTWLVVRNCSRRHFWLGYRITTAPLFFQTDTIFAYLLLRGVLAL